MTHPLDPFHSPQRGALHDHMAGLAEEVTPVDLRDRILSTSRRATARRRVLVTSAAAVAAVAIVSGVAWAGLPAPKGVAPAVSPSASASASASASPSASSSASPAPSITPSRSESPAMVRLSVPQRLFYLSYVGELQRLDGTTAVPLFDPRTPSCGLVISPDRDRIAYVRSDGGGATGDLIVAGPTGSGKKTVLSGVACTGGNSPVWLPGSTKLLLRQGNTGPRVVVDVRTGTVSSSPLKKVTGYVAWSPDGSHLAYREAGKIVVARPDGTVVHRVAHGDETPTGGFSVQGVSDDGRRVVVGMNNSDPGFIRTGFRLVDTSSGQNVSLPSSIAPADVRRAALYPAADNHLLVRVQDGNLRKLYLVSPGGKVLDSRTEPDDLRTATLLTSH